MIVITERRVKGVFHKSMRKVIARCKLPNLADGDKATKEKKLMELLGQLLTHAGKQASYEICNLLQLANDRF